MKLIARQINGRTIRTKNQRLAAGACIVIFACSMIVAAATAMGLPW